MKETLSGKYLAILAAVAVGILFIGARFRPRDNAPAAPSPMEIATLQQRVQRERAASIGQYLASRAAELAGQVVFLPERGTSGVRYESPTQVLTVARPDDVVEPLLMVADTPIATAPASIAAAPWNPDGWVLILGRSPQDQLLWAAGLQGASRTSVCGDVMFGELVLNAALDPSFAGAGAFDLDGGLLGVVMPCGGNLHIVSIASVPDLLAASSKPEREFIEKFGFVTKPLEDSWKEQFPRLSGFLVTDVWMGSWADRSGLMPGDLILSEQQTLDAANLGPELTIAKPGRPGVTRVKLDVPPPETGMAVVVPKSPLPELVISHDTPAERAGLRSGDKLVSILGQRGTSIAILSRLLATPSEKPIRIVYERGARRSMVEVPNE